MDEPRDTRPSYAPRLHALGATARAQLERLRARPELALIDVRTSDDAAPGVPRDPALVICVIDPADEDALPALEAAVRAGRDDGAHAVVVIAPHARLDDRQRQRIATHLGACVLAAPPGPDAMIDAALALATCLASPGLTCVHMEDVASVLRAGATGEVRRARIDAPVEALGPDSPGALAIAVVARALEGTLMDIASFGNRLDEAWPGLEGVVCGTPDALTGERGDVMLFVVTGAPPAAVDDDLAVGFVGVVSDRQVLPTTSGREIAQLVIEVQRTTTGRVQAGLRVRCVAFPEVWARIANSARVGAVLEIVGRRDDEPEGPVVIAEATEAPR